MELPQFFLGDARNADEKIIVFLKVFLFLYHMFISSTNQPYLKSFNDLLFVTYQVSCLGNDNRFFNCTSKKTLYKKGREALIKKFIIILTK